MPEPRLRHRHRTASPAADAARVLGPRPTPGAAAHRSPPAVRAGWCAGGSLAAARATAALLGSVSPQPAALGDTERRCRGLRTPWARCEKLAEVLSRLATGDPVAVGAGEVTADEAADQVSVAQSHELTNEDVLAANRAFVLALAHEAATDGKVSRAERAERKAVAELLAVDAKLLPGLLDCAETARHARLSADLGPLPDPWPHGTPLRVGDKVVFTGCEDQTRDRLEKRSEALGVRVLGSVSAKTAMLVTDGSMAGTKLAKAHELGTRIVHPDTYEALLRHLQPAQPRPGAAG